MNQYHLSYPNGPPGGNGPSGPPGGNGPPGPPGGNPPGPPTSPASTDAMSGQLQEELELGQLVPFLLETFQVLLV